MKNLTELLITEAFSNEELSAIVDSIASMFKLDKENLSFNVGLTLKMNTTFTNGKNPEVDDVITRSIGHIVEGVIKASFPNHIETEVGETDIDIKLQPVSADFDIEANGYKFAIKAAKDGKFDSVNVSKEEREAADYLLVVDYSYAGGKKVTVSDIYITDISGKKMTGKHMNKSLHQSAVHFKK